MQEIKNFYMKFKKLLILVTLVFLAYYLFMIRYDIYNFYELRNCILWKENVQIGIKDFQMKPNYNSKKNLYFWNGINLKSNGFGEAEAVAVFDKSKSWTKDTTNFDYKQLLKLQKLSFDLAEIYTRKMNKEIKNIHYGEINNDLTWYELELISKKIYEEYETLNNKMLYDENRDIEEIILFWRPKVDKMLNEN
jgi:hypothetical protein